MPAEPSAARLAVIIPTLDEERALPRLLASLQQPGRPEDVVVSDGGSTDRTVQLAQAAGARVVTGPRGRGGQLARGARAARGELLLFLHADTVLTAGSLRAVRATFQEPAVGYGALRQRIDGASPLYRWIERAANRRARRGTVFGDSGLCVRREVYEAVGGFSDLPLFEDVELSGRLARRAVCRWIEGAELVLSARRWEREGILRGTARNWLLRLAFRAGIEPERLVRYYRPEPARSPAGPRATHSDP